MKRTLVLLSLLFASSLFAAETHRYIVATNRSPRATNVHALMTTVDFGERNVRTFESIDAFAVDLTDDEAAAMRKAQGVRYVSQTMAIHAVGDVVARTPRAEGNPLLKAQTIPPNIDVIHARELWPLTRGANVNIAIFDTGVDLTHTDLAANIAGGYNTFTKGTDFNDDNLHGTHVFGIVGAIDNDHGVVGVAPAARIYAVKVLDARGSGTDENLVAAADWVIAKKRANGGNWIVSMSLGSLGTTPAETEAFQRMTDEGILSVAASGNDSSDSLLFPAALPNVVSVGAVDNQKVIADFSNYAPTLNVVAPGVSILSTLPMGSIKRSATTVADGTTVTSLPIAGAAFSDVTADWVYCAYGGIGDFPADTRGKIAVIIRGMNLRFSDKIRNARDAGALGAVIINNTADESNKYWTLINPVCDSTGCHSDPDDLAYDWPVVVTMSNAEGAKLVAKTGQPITISAWKDDYGNLSGTSMATPHVSATAALIWSLAPSATANNVAWALRASAVDLGPPGFDDHYGFGLIDALGAAEWLAPAAFGLPPRHPGRQHAAGH